MKKYGIVGIIIFTIVSCNTQKNGSNTSSSISIETVQGTKLLLSDFCSDVNYTKLDTGVLIGTIDKAIFNYNKIYILDSRTKKIAIFDIKGHFIAQTKNTGRGPGEYLNIADFDIDSVNQMIEFWDNGNQKIVRMNQECQILKESPLPLYIENFCKLSSNEYLYYSCNYLNPSLYKNESYNVMLLDSNNNLVKSYLPIENFKYMKLKEPNCFVKYGEGVNIAIPFDNNIYFATNKSCIPKYKITFSNYNLPDQVRESYNNHDVKDRANLSAASRDLFSQINSNNYIIGMFNVFENEKIFLFQYRITKDNTYTVILNKVTRKTKVGILENDLDLGLSGEPIALIKDTLYTYIYPYDLLKRLGSLESNSSFDKTNSKLEKLVSLSYSLQATQNPLIAKFILKYDN